MEPSYMEFVVRAYPDGRRERHAHLYVHDGNGGVRLERRPTGAAATWAEG